MSTNLEIKARCPNLEQVKKLLQKITTQYLGLDEQTDTYFNTPYGRFKLRESSLSGNYLVPYLREDKQHSKKCRYQKIPVDHAGELKQVFTEILSIKIVVQKKREIYLYRNVRIHLDQVDGLGTFIELEAVMEGNENMDNEKNKIEYLMKELDINPIDLIAVSYSDLLIKDA